MTSHPLTCTNRSICHSEAHAAGPDTTVAPVTLEAMSSSRTTSIGGVISLLGAFLAAAMVLGLLAAGLFMPAVGATGALARNGVDIFNELPGEFKTDPLKQQSRILAADGKVIATPAEQNRIIVPLDKVAPIMREAQVAIEDHRFYEHGGFDLQGVVRAARVRDVDDVAEGGEPCPHGGDLLATVDVPVAVAIAGDREQHRGLELPKAVEHAARPELRGARRPDRAEAGRGEEAHERLGDVRHIRGDPVAAPDAEPLEARPGARDLIAQVAEREVERGTGLRAREDGDLVDVLVTTDRVCGVVELRAGKPDGARHVVGGEHPLVRRVRPDLEEVPERRPEALEVVDRPPVERAVVREGEAALAFQPVEVAPDLRTPPRIGRRRPENVPLRGLHACRHSGRAGYTAACVRQPSAYDVRATSL